MPDAVTVDATARGATVTPGAIAVPATLLAGLGAPFNTLDFDGNVRLSWTDWRVLNRNTYGQLVVTLDDIGFARLAREAARVVSGGVAGAGRVGDDRSFDEQRAAAC